MVAGHGGQEGRALHYIDGTWHEGNPPLLGPMTHASWMSSIVFDGARAFEGVTPDIDRHCDRLIASARTMGLVPPLAAGEVEEIVHDGVGRFANGAALYIRPMLWAESGFIVPDPHSTRFCCTLFEAPMPEPKGLGVCLSPYRRPTPETALTLAKASCLYPNSVRAIQDAQARGFDNALIRDSATWARCCRSPAWTTAICSRGRSIPAPASSIGTGRTAAEAAPPISVTIGGLTWARKLCRSSISTTSAPGSPSGASRPAPPPAGTATSTTTL
jgi:hypothetical protein